MVVAVAKALEAGARAIICASTGNTSASAAAYGAAAGIEVVVVLPRGPDRDGQAAPGADGRGARRRDRRQLRPGARHRARAGRTGRPPGDAGQLGQPVPPRRPEDRPRSRSATTSVGRRTSWRSRSATPATSAPTGPGSAPTRRRAASPATPRMWGFQAAGAAPLVSGVRVEHPRPSRPRSGSATRRRGRWPSRPATSPAAASRR